MNHLEEISPDILKSIFFFGVHNDFAHNITLTSHLNLHYFLLCILIHVWVLSPTESWSEYFLGCFQKVFSYWNPVNYSYENKNIG